MNDDDDFPTRGKAAGGKRRREPFIGDIQAWDLTLKEACRNPPSSSLPTPFAPPPCRTPCRPS